MNNKIELKFNSYPLSAKNCLLELRELIFRVAENDGVGAVVEDIKWGQLSYVSDHGSPFRIDWCDTQAKQISLFFHCQSKLIATFKEVYPDTFSYKGNRELLVPVGNLSKNSALSHCISIALKYHKVKHLTLLGA